MAVTISRAFRDISLSFSKHPITNDIIPLNNEDAIKRSVINLVRTRIGERFFNPLIGSEVEDTLFELQIDETSIFLKAQVTTLLNNFEPRIVLRSVDIEYPEDSNDLLIKIVYDIVGLAFPVQNIEFLLLPSRV
jgi:phage baseplate assembly protein W